MRMETGTPILRRRPFDKDAIAKPFRQVNESSHGLSGCFRDPNPLNSTRWRGAVKTTALKLREIVGV